MAFLDSLKREGKARRRKESYLSMNVNSETSGSLRYIRWDQL
jgi:hypothetical protein